MLSPSVPLLSTLLLSVSYSYVLGVSNSVAGQSMALHRRASTSRTVQEWGEWAKAHREKMSAKYGPAGQVQKRGFGTNLITNQNTDSSFFGSLAIGTPPVSYNVILDTGSSDLWVADSRCTVSCSGIATFNPSNSSTFTSEGVPFSISYGSGRASGTLGADLVQMAGFSVSNQTFALCDTVSNGLLTNPVSGLLGLGWKAIATSGAMPLWQALVTGGAWDQPVMAFQLTRFVNDTNAQTLEPGGSFSMGFVNNSLYKGDIEFIPLAATESYWILPLTSLTVQGTSVPVQTGSSAYSAIDTGTTLVGGPSTIISALYAQIPGASLGTGNFNGYYTYPCGSKANVTVAFGGRSWSISEEDFQLAQLTGTDCLGAFFQLQTGRSAPSWIFGDTFLKNVYSVFRYNPPSVGFAELSSVALAQNDANGPVPSATIGSAAATVTATGVPARPTGAASTLRRSVRQCAVVWIVSLVVGIFS